VKIVHGTLETLIPLLFQIDLFVVMAFESKIPQNGFGRLFMDIIVRHQKEKFGNTFFSWRFTPHPHPNASSNANGKIIKLLRRRVGTSLNTFENIFGHIVGT